MSFNIFDDQIKQRREMDQELFEGAFCHLSDIIKQKSHSTSDAVSEEEAKVAISEVLKLLGAVIPEVPESIKDINAQMEYMLRPSGVMRRRVELVGFWWKDAIGIMLGSTIDGKTIVLKPSKILGYEYTDPKTNKVVKVNKKTAKDINTDAFVFYRPFPAKKLSIVDLGIYMLKSINLSDIVLILGSSLLVSLLGLFLPYMNKQIYESVIPSGTKSDVFPVAALLMGAVIASTLFGVIKSIVLGKFRDKLNMSIESAAMMRLFSLPATFFRDYSAGELSNRLMNINSLCNTISDAVLTTGLTAVFSLVYIAQMASFAPALVAPGMLIILISLIFSVLTTFVQLKVSRNQMKISAKLSGMVFALFSGIQKIKLAGAEKRAFAKWAEVYKQEGRLRYSPPMLLRLNATISGAISFGGSIFLYYSAVVNKLSVADYIAFNTAYGSVSGAIMSLSGVALTAATIKPIIEMVKPILDTVPELTESRKIVTALSGSIEINNLTFRYDKDGPAIIDNLSLKIRPGEYVAVVGKTGCGKSTLMRLLLGFEKAETGAIYYDGQDIEKLDVRSVRQCIGVDLQNGKLFSGDIFSNIIVTAPWKTLDDAWEAARMAGMEEDIKAMPMGMHTMLSEGSGGISGGQKQRLLIARAIVSKPKILFFDEATSALDNITQKKVSDSISELKCTRLVIAHRLSTIRHCNRIIVLKNGKVVEEGDYDKLMEKKGLFYEMAVRQTVD
ncbi:NHLP bacteriocin export ABC transporter permease/ATPase subunit [Clostridiaceae bacterium UIB06]|uniref:NHLP bacteriocin export ABC transporter permease/ATPase subunit n=1 Tax=Clostridium thailandense TaxID=2794346 RepID=A0A949TWY3_9CLOT|nr:NHLP bacteriocin export ABC transporter permease/ATPase subunit [Clostridium thailandense]MBV7272458.1 NHLP bacteriocin export ABC transporter permease/ATPase subunit [Clostridium thailandense]MCH5136982.1 NHLP bacteriocin export ABC transporter permease/ATPase subunit [Clostridiaceae bacterium UIB06]